MASICRDSRRVAVQHTLASQDVIPSRSAAPMRPMRPMTQASMKTSVTSTPYESHPKSLETYPDDKAQEQALLPRHSHDLGVAANRKKRKSSRILNVAQFVGSFAVVWLLLNTLFGEHTPSISQIKGTLSSTAMRIASHRANKDHHPGLIALRPLSSEAQTIKNQCDSLPPFPKDVYRNRISNLRHILDKIHEDKAARPLNSMSSGEVFVMEPGASSLYYTGTGSHEWHTSERPFLFLISNRGNGEGKTVLSVLTPAFEASRAKLLSFQGLDTEHEVEFIEWKEEENWAEVLVRYLKTGSGAMGDANWTMKLHFDPAVRTFISAGIAHALVGTDDDVRVSMDVADARILSVRERKSSDEIAVLKCANELTLQAIKATKESMFFGIKESQTLSLLSRYFEELGMPGGEGLVLFGENAALPHGTGTDRALGKRDFALIDAGGKFRGYTSDITRTFALPGSKISDSQERLWHLVKDAQTAALKAGNGGTSGKDVDAAARELIKSRGERQAEREGFTHRLGHGIGLEGHESPYLVGSNDQPIQKGNVFSDEPGIYIPGELGIRLEDCWFVNEEGKGELLTSQAKDYWSI